MSFTYIYIALYYSDFGRGKYHWAIALPRPPEYNVHTALDFYQIGFDDSTNSWYTDHKREGSRALNTRKFMCMIQLPTLSISYNDASLFFQQQEPSRGLTPLLYGRDDWSCAQWVIRTLQRVMHNGWFSATPSGHLNDRDAYYHYVSRTEGLTYEVSVLAGSTSSQYVGQLVNGVRILDKQ